MVKQSVTCIINPQVVFGFQITFQWKHILRKWLARDFWHLMIFKLKISVFSHADTLINYRLMLDATIFPSDAPAICLNHFLSVLVCISVLNLLEINSNLLNHWNLLIKLCKTLLRDPVNFQVNWCLAWWYSDGLLALLSCY